MNRPIVSVSVITYNQEEFLRQTLDSIVAQQTNFAFEIVLGDDCSTDGTRAICYEYKDLYPELIKLRLPENNMGSMPNWIANIKACKGKYIAFCEGDDYWIDDSKLQKQVDFMEKRPSYVMCAHAAQTTFDNVIFEDCVINKQEFTTDDLLATNWGIMTASILFRQSALTMPDWYATIKNGDMGLQLLLSLEGRIGYLSDKMSVYRRHPGGISATLQPLNQAAWLTYLLYQFDKHTKGEYKKQIKKRINQMFKTQIGFAKEYNLRKARVMLTLHQKMNRIVPFMIKNLRK